MQIPPFKIETATAADASRVVVQGELDLSVAEQVSAAIEEAVRGDSPAVVLDLSRVTFLDSTGLRILLSASASSRTDGHRLKIVTSPVVERLIDLTGCRELLALDG